MRRLLAVIEDDVGTIDMFKFASEIDRTLGRAVESIANDDTKEAMALLDRVLSSMPPSMSLVMLLSLSIALAEYLKGDTDDDGRTT